MAAILASRPAWLRTSGFLLVLLAGTAFALPLPAAASERFQVRAASPTPDARPTGPAPTATPKSDPDGQQPRSQAGPTATLTRPSSRATAPAATPTAGATATPLPTPTSEAVSSVSSEVRLPNGLTVAEAYAQALGNAASASTSPAESPAAPGISAESPVAVSPTVSPLAEQVAEPTATPTDEAERAERRRRALALGAAQLAPAPELTSFWQELRFRDLVQRTAAEVGANPAIVTVLLGVEADTEGAPKGVLTDLGPFRQDTLQEGDDPSDQDTLIRRAAEHIRALQERWSLLELVAAAYFGALDERGQVTEASAGQLSGQDYVQRVRAAHKRHLEGQGMLPQWLVSPFGDLPLSSRMIKFGYLSDYGEELAFEIRGEEGVARYSTIHLGLDLQVPGRPEGGRGTPIVAPFAGRILRTADPVGGPFGIWLENRALDLRARLMHMDGLVVGIETGVQVRAGQQLGILGEQGTEGFPHLHLALERISDGARINPALFYRVRDPSDPATATARWPVDLQSAWTQAADFRWFNTRLVPYDRPTTAQVSRSVPLEVPTQ